MRQKRRRRQKGRGRSREKEREGAYKDRGRDTRRFGEGRKERQGGTQGVT